MKKWLRRVSIGVLLLVVLAGLSWWLFRPNLRPRPDIAVLRTGTVRRGTLNVTVSAGGNVQALREAQLAFDTAGSITEINVAVGDMVRQGDTLARLDTTSLEDALREAELSLAQAELNLQTLRKPADSADLELAKLRMQEASQAMKVAELSRAVAEARAANDVDRARELAEDAARAYQDYLEMLDRYGLPEGLAAGITAVYMEAEGNVGITQLKGDYAIQQAKSQWASAYQRYVQAQRDLSKLESGTDTYQIRLAELQVASAKLNLEQRRADLEAAELRAPMDGVITSSDIEIGDTVIAGQPVITLLDEKSLIAELTVDEIDIGKLQVGQPVTLTLDAYPDIALQGAIDQIGILPRQRSGVVNYGVRVHLMEPTSIAIRQGMTVNAVVTIQEVPDMLLIPSWAVRTDQATGDVYTYRLKDGIPERVTLQIGLFNETWSEVRAGLEEGDTVALVSEATKLLEFHGPPSGR